MQQLKDFFENLSNENRIITTVCFLWGWFCNLFLLDAVTLWEYVIKTIFGLITMCITVFAGLVIKDFYAIKVKPKLFKNVTQKSDKEAA